MTLYTIGHSNIDTDDLIKLLRQENIEVLVDVRSSPYSKYAAQFNKEHLIKVLEVSGIKYVFMGDLLGGRPDDKSCYINDKPNYDLIRQKDFYQRGLERLMKGIAQYRVAIMCSEEDPYKCHRTKLIAKDLHKMGVEILHIRGDGKTQKDECLKKDAIQESLF